MKNIILVKSHDIIQLGHLYEHLFVMRFKDFMYQRGLYKVVDYAVHGTTYGNTGIIEINIELFSGEAIKLADDIAELKIDLGEDNINATSALYQIFAEEDHQLYVSDKAELIGSLIELDNQPWSDYNDIGLMDGKKFRPKNDLIYLTNKAQSKPKVLRIEFQPVKEFVRNHRELLPLLNIVVRFLSFTAADVITKEQGYYYGEFYCTSKNQRYTNELWVNSELKDNVDIDQLMDRAVDTISDITSVETIHRMVSGLQSFSVDSSPHELPDHERIERDTGIYISPDGWKSIANDKNVAAVLDSLGITVRYGRNNCINTVENKHGDQTYSMACD